MNDIISCHEIVITEINELCKMQKRNTLLLDQHVGLTWICLLAHHHQHRWFEDRCDTGQAAQLYCGLSRLKCPQYELDGTDKRYPVRSTAEISAAGDKAHDKLLNYDRSIKDQ
jgi:hypothetical protein